MNKFDLRQGQILRDEGMSVAAQSNKEALRLAKDIAVHIATESPQRECTIDEVQEVLLTENIKLGMAAGSVFRDDCWEWTGSLKSSCRTTNHARPVKVWRLK